MRLRIVIKETFFPIIRFARLPIDMISIKKIYPCTAHNSSFNLLKDGLIFFKYNLQFFCYATQKHLRLGLSPK
jgi:hypothetical protein